MGTRNSPDQNAQSSKKLSLIAEAAVSPPFVIEWRQTQSPEVAISPSDVGNKRLQRQTRQSLASKAAARAVCPSAETPHHAHLIPKPVKNLNTPDDIDDQVPAKKTKSMRLDSLKELKSAIAAKMRYPQLSNGRSPGNDGSKMFSNASKRAANVGISTINALNTNNNDSLNDDSFNMLMSQALDSVERRNQFTSPVMQPSPASFQNRQSSLSNSITSGMSTPLRCSKSSLKTRTPRFSTEYDKEVLSVQKISKAANSPTELTTANPKRPSAVSEIIIEDDDEFDAALIQALDSVEESSNGGNPTTNENHGFEHDKPCVAELRNVSPNLLAPSSSLGKRSDSNFDNNINYGPSSVAARPLSVNNNKGVVATIGGLSLEEKKAIEEKRRQALEKLKQKHSMNFSGGAGRAVSNQPVFQQPCKPSNVFKQTAVNGALQGNRVLSFPNKANESRSQSFNH